MHNTGLLSAHA